MTLTLYFVHSTDNARLYRRKDGREIWIPRSVTKSTMKHPANAVGAAIHEIEVEDWWAEKHWRE